MKNTILFFFLFLSIALSAQSFELEGTTRAVIIGISDYQNEDIPDLRFADKDAEAFAEYLRSSAGGQLANENIKLLTNEKATTAQIAAALEWLVEVSEEDDQALIYFSGHGDVETKTMFQLGYLLTWDSPSRTYVAGAFPLQYLQAVVSTLSLQNNVEVLLITDACRAGKLAGNSIGGAKITNANLSKQFAHEVKILSCQPDEFSIEGEQWGGGRGVFSYHLTDGLYGFADNNDDLAVNLFEIGRYLEDKVATQASPHSQFPMVIGRKTKTLAYVDEIAFDALKSKRLNNTPILASVDSRGIDDLILMDSDSVWQKKYRQFSVALDEGHLLDAPQGKTAAYELFLELSKVAELKKIHGTIKRNLAAALQDDAQQAINAYLQANPTELSKRYATETNYNTYPQYLRKAAEILGENNFYYPYVMAKLYYFEGLRMRLDREKGLENVSYESARNLQLKALEFQQQAPFVLNELGVLHTRLGMNTVAMDYYNEAIEVAPEWGLPYVNLCMEFFYSNNKPEAIKYGEKAMDRLPDYPQLLNLLGWIHADRKEEVDRSMSSRTGVELKNDLVYRPNNALTLAQKKRHYKKTIELLEQAIKIDPDFVSGHLNLGFCYLEIGEADKAIAQLKNALVLDSTNHFIYARLGDSYRAKNNLTEGVKAYEKAIALLPPDSWDASNWYSNMSILYTINGMIDTAIQKSLKAVEFCDNTYAFSQLSTKYLIKGDFEKAEYYGLQAISINPLPNLLFDKGSLYAQINRKEDAEWMFLKALELFPDYDKAIMGLVTLYFRNEAYEKTIEYTLRLLETDPENPVYFAVLNIAYEKINQFQKAETYAKKLAAIEFKNVSYIGFVAYQYLYFKDFEKADYFYKKAEALEPDNKWNHWNRASYYSMKEEPKKAIQSFEKALENGLDDFIYIHSYPEATNMRAEPEFKLLMEKYFPGQVYEGPVTFSENIEPMYFPKNCLLLGEYYESIGESDRATNLYQKATALNTDSLSTTNKLAIARIFLKLDKPEEAEAICPEEVFTDDPEENYQVGILYYSLKKGQNAEQHFKRYLELSTDKLKYRKVTLYYYLQGEEILAEKYMRQWIDQNPNNLQVYLSLGFLKYNAGKYEESQAAFDEGSAKFPNEIIFSIAKAATMAYAYPEKDAALAVNHLEEFIPATPKIINFINLVNSNQFEQAAKALKKIDQSKMHPFVFIFFQYGKLRILVAQNDFDEAMQVITINQGNLFTFQNLQTDLALASLRQTEQFKEYMRKTFPGKMND